MGNRAAMGRRNKNPRSGCRWKAVDSFLCTSPSPAPSLASPLFFLPPTLLFLCLTSHFISQISALCAPASCTRFIHSLPLLDRYICVGC